MYRCTHVGTHMCMPMRIVYARVHRHANIILRLYTRTYQGTDARVYDECRHVLAQMHGHTYLGMYICASAHMHTCKSAYKNENIDCGGFQIFGWMCTCPYMVCVCIHMIWTDLYLRTERHLHTCAWLHSCARACMLVFFIRPHYMSVHGHTYM